MKLRYRKYPQLVNSMVTRDRQYNETLDYIRCREEARELLVIRPLEKLPISRTEKDPQVLRQVYEIGREVCASRIEEIGRFFSET
jgi:predicted patatin/cPLA2 family phospholipase